MNELRQLLPTVNAILNGTAAVLLVAGYAAIRSRRVRLHVTCMLGALVVSALFLTSYLVYHFALQDPELSKFRGTGWLRPVYFVILISHIILAVVAAPLELITAYLGLRGRFPRHVKVARWTFPIWLYVSVTGVVVYWMLYRL